MTEVQVVLGRKNKIWGEDGEGARRSECGIYCVRRCEG